MLEIQPGVLTELVAALGQDARAFPALATHISHDALFALTVLKCARRAENGNSASDRLPLADTLNCLGPEFVRTLVLSARPAPLEQQPQWEAGIRVACLAKLIAARTQACDEEEAWLAGLAHNLNEYPRFAEAASLDELLAVADDHGFVGDAVRFCRASPARVKSAHALVRVLQLAVSLVYSVYVNGNVGVRAALGGLSLDIAEVERLQAEADYLAQEAIHRYASREIVSASSGGLAQSYAAIARASSLQDYLNAATDRESLANRSIQALRALFGVESAVLLEAQSNCLAPVSWWPAPAGLSALCLPADYAQSAPARAAGGESVCWRAAQADQFPVVDAQVARLMGATTLQCEPLGAETGPKYILLAANVPEDAAMQSLWKALLQSLASRLVGSQNGATPQSTTSDAIPRQEVRKAVHEAANPLTIIRNYVNLMSSRFAQDNETQRDLAIIGGEIERVAGILHGLGAKPQTDEVADPGTWVDINQVISELVRMSLDTLLLPNKVNVQLELDPGMGSIITQRDQLKQVLLNLTKNAVEAMPRGGRLLIASVRAEHDGRNCAVIALHDTGPGLPKHVHDQIFQPAASTKGGDHAGLGLYISHNLVKSMGGDIECDSSPKGTTFRIYLPMAEMAQNQVALQPGGQRN